MQSYDQVILDNNIEADEVLSTFAKINQKVLHLPIQTKRLPTHLKDCLALLHLTPQHKKYEILSDYFHELHRLSAKRNDQDMSPLDFYAENRDLVIGVANRVYDGSKREALKFLTKQCSSFSPFTVIQVLRYFRASRILDLCAGWGDRLIGCLARDEWIEYYCGIDPNTKLHSGYRNMIRMFAPKHSRKKFDMICSGAEDANIPKPPNGKLYDLIFTSPPFYDLEQYSTDSNQSHIKFPSFEDWYNNFLLHIIGNAVDLLQVGGYVALHLDPKWIDRFREDVSTYLKYIGMLYIVNPDYEGTAYEPIIAFQKV